MSSGKLLEVRVADEVTQAASVSFKIRVHILPDIDERVNELKMIQGQCTKFRKAGAARGKIPVAPLI
jgi:hypothetical protein